MLSRVVGCQFLLFFVIFIFTWNSLSVANDKFDGTEGNSNWDGTSYLSKTNNGDTLLSRKKRFVVGELLVVLIVWNMVLAPLFMMTFTKNMDIFGWFKKCWRRAIKNRAFNCMPTTEEIKKREFARQIYLMAFNEVTDKTASLLRHEHNLMVGLEEPNTWNKISERHILFLLLVKYRLLDKDRIPLAFLDKTSVAFWEKWCHRLIGTEDCKSLAQEIKMKSGWEDMETTLSKFQPDVKRKEHLKMDMDKENEKVKRAECQEIVNRNEQIDTEEEANWVENCLNDAQMAMDEGSQFPMMPKYEPLKGNERNRTIRKHIKQLFDGRILNKSVVGRLYLDLMEKENAPERTFWERMKHWHVKHGIFKSGKRVPAIKYVPYRNDGLVQRDDEGHGGNIGLNEQALRAYPPKIRYILRETYKLAEKNLERMDFIENLKNEEVASPLVDDLKGHVSRVYVLIQMRRTICQMFLWVREEKERQESQKERKKEKEEWEKKATEKEKRKYEEEKQKEIESRKKEILEQLKEEATLLKDKLNVPISAEEIELEEEGAEGEEDKMKNGTYKRVSAILEQSCGEFYERNKQERAYLRWSSKFKAIDDLAMYKIGEGKKEKELRGKGGLKMEFCKDFEKRMDCAYRDYDELLEIFFLGYDGSKEDLEPTLSRNSSIFAKTHKFVKQKMRTFSNSLGKQNNKIVPIVKGEGQKHSTALKPKRRRKRVVDFLVLGVAFAGGLLMQQIYKNFDLVQIAKNCGRHWYNYCRTPKNIKQELAFIGRAKQIAIEDMPDELIPRIRRHFELFYIENYHKKDKAPIVPSEFLLQELGIPLKLRHGYLLDCFVYDWDRDQNRWHLNGQNADDAIVSLVEIVSNRCQGIDEFISLENKEVPEGLKPLSSNSQLIAFLENKEFGPTERKFRRMDVNVDMKAFTEWEEKNKEKLKAMDGAK